MRHGCVRFPRGSAGMKLVLIGIGGAFGSVMRYVLAGWVYAVAGAGFPYGTLVVNLTGCLLIGVLSALFSGAMLIREEYRVGLLVGVLGGFTTFSTFGWESWSLLNDRQFFRAGLNVLLSVGLGLAFVWLGYRLTQRVFGV